MKMACQNPLTKESESLGLQYAKVGDVRIRVVHMEVGGPFASLGPTPEKAVDLSCTSPDNVRFPPPPHYPSWLTPPAPYTAFFIHGVGGRSGQFSHQIHFLASHGFRCLGVDLPGHGESRNINGDKDEVCSLSDAVTLLKAVFDCMAGTKDAENTKDGKGRRRRAVLIGHSYGCLELMGMFRELINEGRSKEIASICLLGADGKVKSDRMLPRVLSLIPTFVLSLLRRLMAFWVYMQLYSRFTRMENPSLICKENTINSKNSLEIIKKYATDVSTGVAETSMNTAFSAFRLSEYKPPLLLLYGEMDALTPPEASIRCMCRGLGFDYNSVYSLSPASSITSSPKLPTREINTENNSDKIVVNNNKYKCGSLTAELIRTAGHNFMLENPFGTNCALWKFFRSIE